MWAVVWNMDSSNSLNFNIHYSYFLKNVYIYIYKKKHFRSIWKCQFSILTKENPNLLEWLLSVSGQPVLLLLLLLLFLKVKNNHRSKFFNLSNWKEEAWKKKSELQRDSNPWPPRCWCVALPTELWSHTLGARSIYWVHISCEEWNDVKDMK